MAESLKLLSSYYEFLSQICGVSEIFLLFQLISRAIEFFMLTVTFAIANIFENQELILIKYTEYTSQCLRKYLEIFLKL